MAARGMLHVATVPTKARRTLAIWALGVGVVAFFLGLFPFVGMVAGVSAIALGVLALLKRQTTWMAVVAIVLGALAGITSAVTTANIDAIIAAGREARSDDAKATPTPTPTASPSPSSAQVSTPTPTPSTAPTASTSPTPTPTPRPTATATASRGTTSAGASPPSHPVNSCATSTSARIGH